MRKNGFTLLETLISAIIAATVGILIAQVFFTTTRANTKTELLKDLRQNGQYAMDVLERMMRNAQSVDSTCSDEGATLTSVQFTNPDGNATTIECKTDAQGITRIASTSATGVTDYLTNGNVTIGGTTCGDEANSLRFYCTSFADQPSKVTIEFSLAQAGSPTEEFEQGSVSFQTTVTARN